MLINKEHTTKPGADGVSFDAFLRVYSAMLDV